MIKLEHVVTASPEQMEFIIEGMRNPHNSWDKSDSKYCLSSPIECDDCSFRQYCDGGDAYIIGDDDFKLMNKLSKAGTDHRKYMRMMPVYVSITAPLYWWKEFDTYKVGTVANSCSTMHKIAEKEFTLDDFSTEHLMDDNISYGDDVCLSPLECTKDRIFVLNTCREKFIETKDKKYWWQMIQLLPSSYNQTRNVMLNYEVLANIYKSRRGHKLDEWIEFCKWIESLPYSDIITGASR